MRFKFFSILAAGLLIFSVSSPAHAQVFNANLIVNTVYNTDVYQYYHEVMANISGQTTSFTLNPLELGGLVNSTDRNALVNTALGNLGLNPSQVNNLTTQDIYFGTSTTPHLLSMNVVKTPDASGNVIVIGDPSDLQSDLNGTTVVAEGTVTVTATETTNNQLYNLKINGTVVPEPGTLWMFALGILGMMGMKRKQIIV